MLETGEEVYRYEVHNDPNLEMCPIVKALFTDRIVGEIPNGAMPGDIKFFNKVDALITDGKYKPGVTPHFADRPLWEKFRGPWTKETWVDALTVLPKSGISEPFNTHTMIMSVTKALEMVYSWPMTGNMLRGDNIFRDLYSKGYTQFNYMGKNMFVLREFNIVNSDTLYLVGPPQWAANPVQMGGEIVGFDIIPRAFGKITLRDFR